MPEPLRQANCGVILLWVLQCPEDEVTGALSGGLSGNSPSLAIFHLLNPSAHAVPKAPENASQIDCFHLNPCLRVF